MGLQAILALTLCCCSLVVGFEMLLLPNVPILSPLLAMPRRVAGASVVKVRDVGTSVVRLRDPGPVEQPAPTDARASTAAPDAHAASDAPSSTVVAALHTAEHALHTAATDVFSNTLATLASAAAPRVGARPTSLGPTAQTISVVMPCYGHAKYLEEALGSVVDQTYPPAEVIVVDDGSEDRCGDAAHKLLTGALAERRRRQAEKLIAWWGWGVAELERYSDEVLVTPNRGVAHARNTGIRRARGGWICCLDGDDKVSSEYFLKAMVHSSAHAGANLIYANQQFFGESTWK